jgi:RNA polymerase sigma-70 factor (ECF subfamily)
MEDDEFARHLALALDGDEDAFAALWRAFNPLVVRFVTTLADREDAAEVSSAVWLEVVRGLPRFSGDARGFRAWLFTIARSRLTDLRRARRRRPQRTLEHDEADVRPGTAEDPADVVGGRIATEEALALIGSLPPDQAEVLLLRVVADLDVATIASMLGKRPGTVRVLSHRGLRGLAARLDADGELPRGVTR